MTARSLIKQWTLYQLSLKQALTKKRTLWFLILLLLPALIPAYDWFKFDVRNDPIRSAKDTKFMIAYLEFTVESFYAYVFIPLSIAIIIPLLFSEEITQKTMTYLLTKPLPRWQIVLIKYLAGITVLLALAITSLLVNFLIFARITMVLDQAVSWNVFFWSVFCMFLLILAEGAIIAFLSLSDRNQLFLAIVYTMGYESMFRGIIISLFPALKNFSVLSLTLELVKPVKFQYLNKSASYDVTPSTAISYLIGVTIFFLVIACFRIHRKEFP